MMVGGARPDDIILSCYKLARHYHLDPEIILHKPLSDVQRMVAWTNRMEEEIAAEQEAQQRMRD
jgi:hypothetical protein